MNNFSDNGTIMAIQKENYTENIEQSSITSSHQICSFFLLSLPPFPACLFDVTTEREKTDQIQIFTFHFQIFKSEMQKYATEISVCECQFSILFSPKIDTLPIYLISKEILLINLYINTMKMPEPNNGEKFCLPSWQSIPDLSFKKSISSIL